MKLNRVEPTKDAMNSMIDRTRDAVVSVADRAQDGLESAAEKMAVGAHATGDYVRDGFETATRGAHRRLQDTGQAINRGYIRTRSNLSRATTASTEYVAENPGKALLLTAATGFVLGALVGRRKRSG